MLKKAKKQGNKLFDIYDGSNDPTKLIPKMPKERQLQMIEKIGIQEFD